MLVIAKLRTTSLRPRDAKRCFSRRLRLWWPQLPLPPPSHRLPRHRDPWKTCQGCELFSRWASSVRQRLVTLELKAQRGKWVEQRRRRVQKAWNFSPSLRKKGNFEQKVEVKLGQAAKDRSRRRSEGCQVAICVVSACHVPHEALMPGLKVLGFFHLIFRQNLSIFHNISL